MSVAEILGSEPRKTACKRLQETHTDCECESATAAPGLSPGTVQPGELLIRILPSPHFWDKAKGEPKPSAFSEVASWGMSVTRRAHCTDDDLQRQIAERLGTSGEREFGGLAVAMFDNIKAMQEDGRRCFCVYDTAVPQNLAHADVCQAYVPPPIKSISRERALRKDLQEQFTLYPWDYVPPPPPPNPAAPPMPNGAATTPSP